MSQKRVKSENQNMNVVEHIKQQAVSNIGRVHLRNIYTTYVTLANNKHMKQYQSVFFSNGILGSISTDILSFKYLADDTNAFLSDRQLLKG